MFTPRLCVVLPAADRAQLTDVADSGKTPQKIAIRAQLLVWLAEHVGPAEVARRLRISRNHVHYWVQRYVAQGVSGVLTDAPRPGRRTRLTPERVAAIVTATLTPPPGATPWSTRTHETSRLMGTNPARREISHPFRYRIPLIITMSARPVPNGPLRFRMGVSRRVHQQAGHVSRHRAVRFRFDHDRKVGRHETPVECHCAGKIGKRT